jgi:hypothetical protein
MVNTFTGYSTPGYSGYEKYGLNNLSVIKKAALFPKGTTIASISTAKLQATWLALAKNPLSTRIHPTPLIADVKTTGGTTIFEKLKLSGNAPIREDVTEFELTLDIEPIYAANLEQFNYKNWDIVFIDALNNILGTTPDGIAFKGLSTTSVHFGQMSWSDGTKAALNLLHISLADPMEWKMSPAKITGTSLNWHPLQLDGTTGVNCTVTSSSSAGFTVNVYPFGKDILDTYVAFPGLSKTDFILLKGGVSQPLTGATMTDGGDGSYSFAMTLASGSYTIQLVNANAISVLTYNIESPNPGTFTI